MKFDVKVMLVLGLFDLTVIFTRSEAVRPLFNQYLIGQVIGVFPFIPGNQLPTYLFLENRTKRIIIATVIYIGVNVALNWLDVKCHGNTMDTEGIHQHWTFRTEKTMRPSGLKKGTTKP